MVSAVEIGCNVPGQGNRSPGYDAAVPAEQERVSIPRKFFEQLILLVAILTCVFTWLDAVGGAMGCGSVGAHKICPGVGVYAGLKEVV